MTSADALLAALEALPEHISDGGGAYWHQGDVLKAVRAYVEQQAKEPPPDVRRLLTQTAIDDIRFASEQCEGSEVGRRLLWLARELQAALGARSEEPHQ